MKLWKPLRLDIRIAAEAQQEPREHTWLYSFEPARDDDESTLSVTTVPEFHNITKPGDMMRNFKPTGAFQRLVLEAEHWNPTQPPEWKDNPPPVAETVQVLATVRNDEPVLQLMLSDITGDFRVVQLTEDAAYDVLDGAMRFIRTLRRNDRRTGAR